MKQTSSQHQPKCSLTVEGTTEKAQAIPMTMEEARAIPVTGSRCRQQQLDSGYSWVILFTSFMGYFLNCIGIGCVGLLFPEFLEYFGQSRTATAWIGSLNTAVGALIGKYRPTCNEYAYTVGLRT